MGLSYTLQSNCNHLYTEFRNAYWAIDDLSYDTERCFFRLKAYPSREARAKHLSPLSAPAIKIGASSSPVVNSELYLWEGIFPIGDIFPEGIPLSSDEQKASVYRWIKEYTGIPFGDVFEEGQ